MKYLIAGLLAAASLAAHAATNPFGPGGEWTFSYDEAELEPTCSTGASVGCRLLALDSLTSTSGSFSFSITSPTQLENGLGISLFSKEVDDRGFLSSGGNTSLVVSILITSLDTNATLLNETQNWPMYSFDRRWALNVSTAGSGVNVQTSWTYTPAPNVNLAFYGMGVSMIPEPGTHVLMLGGLAAVGAIARRRARRS